MSYQSKQANKALKAIFNEFMDTYSKICRSSREGYLKTLAPGAEVPKEGMIYGTASRDQFDAEAKKLREKADAIMEEAAAALREKMTAAPSTEAVNTLSALNLRDDTTEDEIDFFLTKYSDNPQVWQTLVSIGRRYGYRDFRNHEVFDQLRKVEDLQRSIDSTLTGANAMSGRVSNGFLSFLELQIDDCFPAD